MTDKRHTIGREGSISGVGLHTACVVTLRFLPAAEGSGITFRRVDLPGSPEIPASIRAVDPRQPRRTVLRNGDAEVQTVEHLLAATMGVGIDDLDIEINGPEAPGLDGSALAFVRVLEDLGRTVLDGERKRITLSRPVLVEDRDSSICAVPHPGGGLRISYVLSYPNPLLQRQIYTFSEQEQDFRSAVAEARTFCMEEEVEVLKKMGFGKGASLENTVVVAGDGSVHGQGLRFPDECARHKVLDLVGDLTLAGAALDAHIYARKTGHRANHELVRLILSASQEPGESVYDINDIQAILPHRYPFLLIDRVLALDPPRRAVGLKNVSISEDFFEGHFPGEPLMPGVLQVEAMAQLAGTLLLRSQNYEGRIALILSMDGLRFRKTVRPGDRLIIEATTEKIKSRTAQVAVTASVDGAVASEAKFRFILVDE